jgi:hypothetical protein
LKDGSRVNPGNVIKVAMEGLEQSRASHGRKTEEEADMFSENQRWSGQERQHREGVHVGKLSIYS